MTAKWHWKENKERDREWSFWTSEKDSWQDCDRYGWEETKKEQWQEDKCEAPALLGPLALPEDCGYLTPAQKEDIKRQSASVRSRPGWDSKALTLSGPPDQLVQARAMALKFLNCEAGSLTGSARCNVEKAGKPAQPNPHSMVVRDLQTQVLHLQSKVQALQALNPSAMVAQAQACACQANWAYEQSMALWNSMSYLLQPQQEALAQQKQEVERLLKRVSCLEERCEQRARPKRNRKDSSSECSDDSLEDEKKSSLSSSASSKTCKAAKQADCFHSLPLF